MIHPLNLTARRLRWMRPIRPADVEEFKRLALEDNHEPIEPTHIFIKDGTMVGGASIAAVPLVLPWFHTKKCLAPDSLYFINQMENLLANCVPQELVAVPFVKNSPFQPYIEKLGYTDAGPVNLTFKKLR